MQLYKDYVTQLVEVLQRTLALGGGELEELSRLLGLRMHAREIISSN